MNKRDELNPFDPPRFENMESEDSYSTEKKKKVDESGVRSLLPHSIFHIYKRCRCWLVLVVRISNGTIWVQFFSNLVKNQCEFHGFNVFDRHLFCCPRNRKRGTHNGAIRFFPKYFLGSTLDLLGDTFDCNKLRAQPGTRRRLNLQAGVGQAVPDETLFWI